MKKWSGFIGVVGLVVLLCGVAGGLIYQSFTNPLIVSHLALGLVLLVSWLITSGAKSLGQAGEVAVGRTARFTVNALLYTAVFAGLLGVANWLVVRHDKRWDLTEQGVYSLSPQSRQLVSGLKKPVRIVIFSQSGGGDEQKAKELLDLYSYHNSAMIKTELVNPRTKPHLIDSMEMKEGNRVYLEYGEGEGKGVSRINEVSEQAVTNALIKLTRGEAKKVYFVRGHGEPQLDDISERGLNTFKATLTDEHFLADSILLGQQAAVPADAAAVVLVAPTKAMLPEEKEMLVKYVNEGGRLLMFTDPRTTTEVKELAGRFGIQVDDNVVVDVELQLFAGPRLGIQPIANTYAPHPITTGLKDDTTYILASSVRPMSEVDGLKDRAVKDATYTALVKSGPNSWGETNLAQLLDASPGSAGKESDDIKGPLSLAVAYEKQLSDTDESSGDSPVKKSARVVVFGDSDFISNAGIGMYANRDLVLGALNWLAGEEGAVAISSKSMRSSLAPMTRENFLFILVASFIVPELLLLFGLFVWWRRKTAEAFA